MREGAGAAWTEIQWPDKSMQSIDTTQYSIIFLFSMAIQFFGKKSDGMEQGARHGYIYKYVRCVNDIKKEKKNHYLSFTAIVKTKVKGEFKFKWAWLILYKGIIEFSLINCKSSDRNTKKEVKVKHYLILKYLLDKGEFGIYTTALEES